MPVFVVYIVFIIFMPILVCLRLAELVVSKRNETWLRAHGAIEYGRNHYPYMIALHTCFIISLIIECLYKTPATFSFLFLYLFIGLTILKMQVVHTLGKYWTTRILRIPGAPLIKKGLYKYFKHPNYAIVVAEVAVIPLIFHLYVTAIVFSLLNAIMLFVRIREENKALG